MFTSDNLFMGDEKIIFRSKKSFSRSPKTNYQLSDVNKTDIGIGQKFKLLICL